MSETGKRRILVTSHGSLGDLNPYIAIALGLQARGHEVAVATGACYRERIESLGLGFHAVRPDSNWVTDPAVMRRIVHPRWGLERVVREIWLAWLRETYEDLTVAARGADLMVVMQANCAGRLVAEKIGIPWVSTMHLPIGVSSAYDPPILPGFVRLSKSLRFLGPAFWSPLRHVIRWGTRHWSKPLHRLRQEIGLPADTSLNPLIDGYAPLLHLALFSPVLLAKQPDWPAQAVVAGFPWHDHPSAATLPPEVERFVDDGAAPIVFTLGTAIAEDGFALQFFEHSAAAARLLGRRAILIVHNPRNRPSQLPPGVAAIEFAPFPALFPRAAAVVHHGGIGTTGLAMRGGRPMLVVPFAWDQPDNAARAARLGIARTIHPRRYRPERVAVELHRLLEDPAYSRRAAAVADRVQKEDGVGVACDALEAVVRAPG